MSKKATSKDWQTLRKKVLRAKRTATIERVTREFDKRFEMDGAIAVYDLPESEKPWEEQECGIDYYLPAELAEYAILNIEAWSNG